MFAINWLCWFDSVGGVCFCHSPAFVHVEQKNFTAVSIGEHVYIFYVRGFLQIECYNIHPCSFHKQSHVFKGEREQELQKSLYFYTYIYIFFLT